MSTLSQRLRDSPTPENDPNLPDEAADEIDRLTAELDQHKKSAAFCDEHQPKGGQRGLCLVCACQNLSSALSRISYLCGQPNEMQCGPYDIHCDETAVVEQVERLTARVALWQSLYRRALSEANGLTNYVEDRPELYSAEKRLKRIVEDARAALEAKHE